jgi:hypothetical protein
MAGGTGNIIRKKRDENILYFSLMGSEQDISEPWKK